MKQAVALMLDPRSLDQLTATLDFEPGATVAAVYTAPVLSLTFPDQPEISDESPDSARQAPP